MTIGWDPLLCAASAAELTERIRGDRARSLVVDGGSRVLALFLDEHTVVVELSRGWIGLLPAMDRPAAAQPLRHRVREVVSPFDESILTIRLAPIRSRAEPLAVVLELIGTRRNAVAVDERSGVIRHVVSPRDRGRILQVGAFYAAPRPTGRLGPEHLRDRAGWDRALDGAGDSEEPLRRRILERVAFTSSLNVDWMLDGDPWRRWKEIVDPATWGGYLVAGRDGPQPYPVPLSDAPSPPSKDAAPGTLNLPAGPFSDLLTAFRIARTTGDAPPLAAVASPGGAFDRGARALARAKKRLRALERELERAPDPEAARRTGDLLLSRLHEVDRGDERVTLEDFDGGPVEVRLDPALTPAENADAYYQKAARAERANDALPGRIERAAADVDRLERLLSAYEAGDESEASLLAALGPAARRPERQKARGDTATRPYRTYRSSGGLEIRVGRGARHNDDLTFHHSAPEDVWLHALQTSGAHVILRWGKKERPPRRDLAEAAVLAAIHSGGRHSRSVAVGWTKRKYVRKPRGAPPGSVSPERVETVFVTPDESLEERLAAEPESS